MYTVYDRNRTVLMIYYYELAPFVKKFLPSPWDAYTKRQKSSSVSSSWRAKEGQILSNAWYHLGTFLVGRKWGGSQISICDCTNIDIVPALSLRSKLIQVKYEKQFVRESFECHFNFAAVLPNEVLIAEKLDLWNDLLQASEKPYFRVKGVEIGIFRNDVQWQIQ